MLDTLFEQLNANTVVITSTQRLSLILNQQYLNYQQQQQRTCWPFAAIYSLQSWLEQLWQQLCEYLFIVPQPVLTDFQELTLWEQIISTCTRDTGLLRTNQTASLALQAWHLLHRWGGTLTADFDATEDTAAFKEWALRYEQHCQQQGWLNQTTLIDAIITALARIPSSYPAKSLILIGFIELTPQQQRLLTALKTAGYTISYYHPRTPTTTPQLLTCQDREQEFTTAAQWVKQTLSSTTSLIGCIVPQLAQHRAQITAIFTHILCPEYLLNPATVSLPFNIAANIALSEYPLIQAAMHCLQLLLPPIPIEILSATLRSPFLIGAEREQTARALFDKQLCTLGERGFDLKDIAQKISEVNNSDQRSYTVPALQECIEQLIELYQDAYATRSPSDWVVFFQHALRIMGWPGDQTLTSQEYQVKERWQEALQEFANLNLIMPIMTLAQAYMRLNQLLQRIVFQPRMNTSSIYILEPADALGFPCSHLWITSMDDHHWPSPPKPNPFIPFRLQIRLAMPQATAEQTLQYYQQLLTQLTATAQETLFSYALHNKEEQLRPSTLLAEIVTPITRIDLALPATETVTRQLFNTRQLEYLIDEQGPAITTRDPIKGGINIFKSQAACPFKAFAEYRLGAQSIATPQTGLSASERGNLVHQAMEYLWKRIANHTALCRYTDQQLHLLVQRATQKAVLALKSKRPQLLKPRFIAIEIKRLTAIIQHWLMLEKQRPAFEVMATEFKQAHTFAGIPLQMRIDRIDQLANGTHLIIDYKTGACSENAWLGERPDDPQLPFYCITSDRPVSGLLFAQIASREYKFKGIIDVASQAMAPNNLKPVNDWVEQNTLWQATLNQLAEQFRTGYAKVDPKNSHKTCQFCDLRLFCRVNEPMEATES